MEEHMPTVFVSHSSEDTQFIERELIPILKSRKIEVWYSPQTIKTAEEWERAIKRGLESSDWFLVALSPRSVKSKWVRAETGWAFANREGKIIPVLIEACDPFELHILLNGLEFADFRRDPRKGSERLLAIFNDLPTKVDDGSDETNEEQTVDNSSLKVYAHTLMVKGDFDGAIAELNDALELSPQDSGAYFLRGVCHLGKSDSDAAIADLTRAIDGKLNPLALSLAYMYRARAHAAKGADQRAFADCTEALRSDDNNADAYLLRGKLRRRNLEREGAVADFNEAIRLKPTSSEAFIQRAQAFREIGDTAKAKADYAEAVKLDPKVYEMVPTHLRDTQIRNTELSSSTASRIEEALGSLRALGFLTQMDKMSPAAKVKALNDLMAIGFPKVMADLDYLINNLPKGSKELELAIILEDVARKAGLKK
jgi:tetratricopeptide (TPR) repeat protein